MQRRFAKSTLTTFALYAMSSAIRVQEEGNDDVREVIGKWLKGAAGDGYTAELQTCFIGRIKGELDGLQAVIDDLKAGGTNTSATLALMDETLAWPAVHADCAGEGPERVEELSRLATDFADAEALEGAVTARLTATPEHTAPSPAPDGGAALAQAGDGPATCWKTTHTRDGGRFRSWCPPGEENDAGLCYPECDHGYYGVGPVCWQHCPPNTTDIGAFCAKSWWDYCPDDMVGVGLACTKNSYGRGVGKIP